MTVGFYCFRGILETDLKVLADKVVCLFVLTDCVYTVAAAAAVVAAAPTDQLATATETSVW